MGWGLGAGMGLVFVCGCGHVPRATHGQPRPRANKEVVLVKGVGSLSVCFEKYTVDFISIRKFWTGAGGGGGVRRSSKLKYSEMW